MPPKDSIWTCVSVSYQHQEGHKSPAAIIPSTHEGRHLRSHEDTHLKYFTYGIKKPAMRVDLLLNFSLQHKDNLDGNKAIRIIAARQNKLWSRIY